MSASMVFSSSDIPEISSMLQRRGCVGGSIGLRHLGLRLSWIYKCLVEASGQKMSALTKGTCFETFFLFSQKRFSFSALLRA